MVTCLIKRLCQQHIKKILVISERHVTSWTWSFVDSTVLLRMKVRFMTRLWYSPKAQLKSHYGKIHVIRRNRVLLLQWIPLKINCMKHVLRVVINFQETNSSSNVNIYKKEKKHNSIAKYYLRYLFIHDFIKETQ